MAALRTESGRRFLVQLEFIDEASPLSRNLRSTARVAFDDAADGCREHADERLPEFARCPKRQRLTVWSQSITDSGLTSLPACRTLQELNVRNTSVK